jgi:hypothetical protein
MTWRERLGWLVMFAIITAVNMHFGTVILP